MKNLKYYVQIAVGLLLAFFVMVTRGLFTAEKVSDVIMYIGDGFTVAGVLYLGVGALIWISSTGFFDIFGFAVKKAAHAIVPGMIDNIDGNYYEYKVQMTEKRKAFFHYFTLILGLVFLAISAIFLFIWYQVI